MRLSAPPDTRHPPYKLGRPAFGGSTGRPLGISFRMSRAGTARIRVTQGAHTVKTYSRRVRAGASTQRLRLSARGLAGATTASGSSSAAAAT